VKPVLSVVAASRNDGHGGHLTERMQWFIDGLAYHAESLHTDIELVMVEWNPPADAASLSEILRWPPAGSRLTARVVVVSPEEHRELDPAGRLPFYQMIAKNAGIRRATGEYVLATNIDILLSTELFGRIVTGLEPATLYRADRHDIDFPYDRPMTVPEALGHCAREPIRMMRADGVYYPGRGRVMPNYRGTADYLMVQLRQRSRSLLGRDGGLRPTRSEPAPATILGRVRQVAALGADKARGALDHRQLPKLHTNACGDFTLLARDDWSRLRGYPEWPMFSWNLDSVLLYQAAAAGVREVDLPPSMPVFHMEHEKGSGWTPEGHGDLFGRLERGGVEYLTDRGLRLEAVALVRRGRRGEPPALNGPDWGLAAADLRTLTCVA
jgi:hypothetical protein